MFLSCSYENKLGLKNAAEISLKSWYAPGRGPSLKDLSRFIVSLYSRSHGTMIRRAHCFTMEKSYFSKKKSISRRGVPSSIAISLTWIEENVHLTEKQPESGSRALFSGCQLVTDIQTYPCPQASVRVTTRRPLLRLKFLIFYHCLALFLKFRKVQLAGVCQVIITSPPKRQNFIN